MTSLKILFCRSLVIAVLLLASSVSETLAKEGLQFVKNQGQWPLGILYSADLPGGKLVLMEDRMVFLFYDDQHVGHGLLHQANEEGVIDNLVQRLNPDKIDAHRYDIVFGAEPSSVTGQKSTAPRYNYFLGNDPAKWSSSVPAFKQITYRELYAGIDLVLYSQGSQLKYDFVVHPGADPKLIRLRYEGLEEINLKDGKLELKTSFDHLTEEIPFAFQDYDGIRRSVSYKYVLEGDEVFFVSEDFIDVSRDLVIDPILIFSTYSGSAADNWGNTATFDDNGNLYSGGITNHTRGNLGFLGEFPATPGAFQEDYAGIWDNAIIKYDSTGSELIFATYLGGSGSESPQSLIVNNAGDLVILGVTGSNDFPVTSNTIQPFFKGGTPGEQIINGVGVPNGSDLFISILSSDGSTLKASTYFGGGANDGIIESFTSINKNYGDQSRGDVIVDAQDNIYIASRSHSVNLGEGAFTNAHSGKVDGFAAKFSNDLTRLLWGRYFGGSEDDVALSIKLFEDKVYVAGGTASIDFPTTPGALYPQPTGNIDGWIAGVLPEVDSVLYATYVGTTDYDQVYQMDIDSDGFVYVVGQTRGPYPITDGVYSVPNSGQFMHKLNPSLDATIWSTLFGAGDGEPDISITAFLVNDCNNIYVSGWGSNTLIQNFINAGFPFTFLNTTGLPTTFDAVQNSTAGSDFYLSVFTDDASELLYATFFGSSSSQVHVDGGTSRFDKQGIVYHSVCASCGLDDSSFPTTPGAWAEENGSRGCNNAVFKFDLANIDARFDTNSENLDNPGVTAGCPPFMVAFENKSVGGQVFEWDFGDGADTVTSVRDTIFHLFEAPGKYNVQLRIFDQTTCREEDFAYSVIEVFSTGFNVSNDVTICGGSSINLTASGGVEYLWSPQEGLSGVESATVVASPDSTTTYYVDITDANGCFYEDSVLVSVIPEIMPLMSVRQVDKCEGIPIVIAENQSRNFDAADWEVDGANVFSNDSTATIQFDEAGEYLVRLILNNRQCEKEIQESVLIEELFVPNVFTPNDDGLNDFFTITSALPVDLTVVNRYGKVVFEAEEYQNTWNGGDLPSGIYYYDIKFQDGEVCNSWVQILK